VRYHKASLGSEDHSQHTFSRPRPILPLVLSHTTSTCSECRCALLDILSSCAVCDANRLSPKHRVSRNCAIDQGLVSFVPSHHYPALTQELATIQMRAEWVSLCYKVRCICPWGRWLCLTSSSAVLGANDLRSKMTITRVGNWSFTPFPPFPATLFPNMAVWNATSAVRNMTYQIQVSWPFEWESREVPGKSALTMSVFSVGFLKMSSILTMTGTFLTATPWA